MNTEFDKVYSPIIQANADYAEIVALPMLYHTLILPGRDNRCDPGVSFNSTFPIELNGIVDQNYYYRMIIEINEGKYDGRNVANAILILSNICLILTIVLFAIFVASLNSKSASYLAYAAVSFLILFFLTYNYRQKFILKHLGAYIINKCATATADYSSINSTEFYYKLIKTSSGWGLDRSTTYTHTIYIKYYYSIGPATNIDINNVMVPV